MSARRGDDELEVIDRDGLCKGVVACFREGHDVTFATTLPDDGELVAGEPSEKITWLERAGHAVRELDQQLVAGVMPERVVDLLETIQVEHHDEGQVVTDTTCGNIHDLVLERGPVGEAGQSVVSCLSFDSAVEQTLTETRAQLIGQVLNP
jgi:hypothetical protein